MATHKRARREVALSDDARVTCRSVAQLELKLQETLPVGSGDIWRHCIASFLEMAELNKLVQSCQRMRSLLQGQLARLRV